jgi:hypothetical protein
MDLQPIRAFLKSKLTDERIERLKRFQALRFRRTQHVLARVFFGRNLKALSVINHSDKWGYHFYAPHYERHFKPYRKSAVNLLEIGIGGYDDPRVGGGSLRMWRSFFPKGRIAGIDIYDKKLHEEGRIRTFQGSQVDPEFLDAVIGTMGAPDIIIDDGSHLNEHVIESFRLLFPKLAEGGLYVVEDTHTSYLESKGGNHRDLNDPKTSMGYLKQLVDSVNAQEIEGRHPLLGDGAIIGIHFYHSLVTAIP